MKTFFYFYLFFNWVLTLQNIWKNNDFCTTSGRPVERREKVVVYMTVPTLRHGYVLIILDSG